MNRFTDFRTLPNGDKEWTHQAGDRYIVTGVDREGKRFRRDCGQNWFMARGINAWCGSWWLQRGGQRKLLRRVLN